MHSFKACLFPYLCPTITFHITPKRTGLFSLHFRRKSATDQGTRHVFISKLSLDCSGRELLQVILQSRVCEANDA